LPFAVCAWACRTAPVRADDACVVYAAAATMAATTNVVLIMVILHMLTEAKQARFLKPRAVNVRNYFMTGDHQSAIGMCTTQVRGREYYDASRSLFIRGAPMRTTALGDAP
jgi:hypothetical protein